MSDLLPRVDSCQNCGSPAGANYCPACGQDSRDHAVSIRLLMRDFAADVFTYDSRFFRSFVPLLFKPGDLTVEYVRGRRVRYIPPLRLYVFVSLLFFFVLSVQVNTGLSESDMFNDDGAALPDSTDISLILELADEYPGLADAGASRPSWVAARFAERDSLGDDRERDDGAWFRISGEEVSAAEFRSVIEGAVRLVPKAMFLLQPLMAGLLALVYRRSRRRFIEHLVLSLHLHAFMFLAFTVVMLVPWKPIALVAFAWMHVYMFVALRRVFGQGWAKTGIKFLLLTSVYNTMIFIVIIGVMTSTAGLVELAESQPTLVRWLLQ